MQVSDTAPQSARLQPGTRYRGRFAPSPTGALHLGSLTAALGSWLLARHAGGDWLVRIEDIDPPREIPGAARQQIETLRAFGMESDEAIVFQSDRSALYETALQRLLAEGRAFPCLCSRGDLAAADGIHRACVPRPSGKTAAIRLRVPDAEIGFDDRIRGPYRQNLAREVGDVVLKRADGLWAYQLAVVVDDHAQGITEVVRGADLLDSTPRQIWLQRQVGLPTPSYAHLPLLKLRQGEKLGKSLASRPIDPADPLPALGAAYAWLGQDPNELGGGSKTPSAWLNAAVATFQPGLVPARDIVLDE
ncbi:tRNA glutamyl-Q(34) synthetase GluQRS [Arenimonas sp.]|uniref:tRNA glutamyl-Q(34) synthetase GluQRS n=1 Tax=Arenimonas sp. TaxID=1872635 RepID=UPI0039E6E793